MMLVFSFVVTRLVRDPRRSLFEYDAEREEMKKR